MRHHQLEKHVHWATARRFRHCLHIPGRSSAMLYSKGSVFSTRSTLRERRGLNLWVPRRRRPQSRACVRSEHQGEWQCMVLSVNNIHTGQRDSP